MKRYEKYRPSGVDWIGDVPEQWEVMKLLYCLRQPICDGPHETPTLVEEGVPFISIDSLNDTKQIDLSKATKYISEEDYLTYMKKAKLEKGDVLFTKAATIGKTAIVGDEHFMVWSPLAILKNNRSKLSNLYLYYLLNCQRLVTSIVLSGSYNTQINVGMREMEKAYITVPSFAEQEAIAAYLDARCGDIDKVVATQEKRIALLNEMKQSIITQAVTQGLNPDAKMKDSGVEWIGMVPEHWVVTRIGRLADNVPYAMVDGPFGSDMKNEEYVDEGVPIVQLTNIKPFYHYMGFQNYITEEKHQQLIRHTAKCGDIVIAKMMPAGRACVLSADYPEYVVAADAIRFAVSPDADKAFVLYCLNTYCMQECELVSKGTTRVRINLEIARKLNIAMPPKNEQTEIVLFLEKRCSEIDKQIKAVTRQIELLREYKQSLITEVVTGKRKVC